MPFTLEPFYPHTPAFLEVVSVYQRVWGGNTEPMSSSIEFFIRQSTYPDWHGFLARDSDMVVQGFAFGSVVQAGQWWFDRVSSALKLEPTWCLVELGVLAGARRQGIAQALHDALLQTATMPNVALSTQVNNTAALGFYKKNGYSTLLESLVFTPGLIPYTILGKSLTRVSEHGLRSRAGGFIVRANQVLLMQRQKPERGTYFVIPGGSCENQETPEQGAIRELLEETNLEFTLGAKLYESYNPKSQRTAHYFIAQYQSGEPKLHPDAPEILEKQSHNNLYLPTWVKLEDVKHLPLFPSIIRNRLEQDLQQFPTLPMRLEEYD